jgi:hypothetical protein
LTISSISLPDVSSIPVVSIDPYNPVQVDSPQWGINRSSRQEAFSSAAPTADHPSTVGGRQPLWPRRGLRKSAYRTADVRPRPGRFRVVPCMDGARGARGKSDICGKPVMCHANKERVFLFGTDQRITSGPAAITAAFRGRIHGCTRTLRDRRSRPFRINVFITPCSS